MSAGTVNPRSRFIWLVAAALGGASALLHIPQLVKGNSTWFDNDDISWVIGNGLLYAAPLFLGILAGVARPDRPGRISLALVGVTLATAAPLMLRDFLCLIYIVPVNVVVAPLVAQLVGWLTRARRRRRAGAGGAELLLLLIPFASALANRLVPPPLPEPVEIVDTVTLNLPRAQVWRSLDRLHLRFADEAPWIVRALLPVPERIEGGGTHVGAERRVLFSNGVALGRVTESSPPTSFTFELAVLAGGPGFFDHWVALKDSVIALAELPGDRTQVTHRTRYQPLATPRWYFEPGERWLGRLVQAYMLEAYGRALGELELMATR